MAKGRIGGFLRRLPALIRPGGGDDAATDCALLERFFRDGDQAAFAALLQRHGGMVRGVCWRILGDAHAVDDAFQATFLVLASKGTTIRWQASLAGWLWAVAYRVASKARVRDARRLRLESEVGRTMHDQKTAASADDDLRDALNEELARLPEKYRLPLVLCYLEGHSTDQAAEQLCWPRGTVAGRLARARDLLRRRLDRRKLAASTAALATALALPSVAPAAENTVAATVQAASLLAIGTGIRHVGLSASVVELVQGALKDMFHANLKIALVALVLCGGLTFGTGRLAQHVFGKAEAAGVANAPVEPDRERQAIRVRHLKLDAKPFVPEGRDALKAFQREVFTTRVFATLEDATDALDQQFDMKPLARQVDFARERVVFVRWQTVVACQATLHHEVKKNGESVAVRFFTRPAREFSSSLRGRTQINGDFFAVPLDVTVNPRVDEEEFPAVRFLSQFRPDAQTPAPRADFDVALIHDAKEAEKVLGEAGARSIADHVDFTRQKVARVFIVSGGGTTGNQHPSHAPEWEMTPVGAGHEIRFFPHQHQPETRGKNEPKLRSDHYCLVMPRDLKLQLARRLSVKPDPKASLEATKLEALAFTSPDSAQALGKPTADQLAGQVDFSMEKVVCVRWGSSGPPFDTLGHEVKPSDGGCEMRFFVVSAGAGPRDAAYRVGQEFYAVPKLVKITPEPKAEK